MSDPILWLIFYVSAGLYTVAFNLCRSGTVRHFRAAALWPIFWLAVAFSSRKSA